MLRTTLRPYQKEAVYKALGHDGFLFILEQRTGKCLCTIAVIDQRKPDELVIVCPIAAMKVWVKQLEIHLDCDWKMHVTVLNYEELMRRREEWYEWGKRMRREGRTVMIVGDELHKIKKRGAKQSRALRQLGKYAKWRIGCTGTPIAQGIQDAWAQCNFVEPRLFGPFDTRIQKKTGRVLAVGFSDRYLIMGGYRNTQVVGEQNLDDFNEKFHSISYRKTLREARGKERPLKLRYVKRYVNLREEARSLYNELEEELIVYVNQKKIKTPLIISLSMKLQQIAGGHIIDEEGIPHRVGREKILELTTVAGSLYFNGDKFVVVCRFIHEIERIDRKLRGLGITTKIVRGGEPYDNIFDTDCIILQVQSGIAVDMALANHLIFYSWDYSYLNFDQAKFRILDYDKPQASFYFLIVRDTIDEQIYEAVRRKKNLAQLVLDRYRTRRRT